MLQAGSYSTNVLRRRRNKHYKVSPKCKQCSEVRSQGCSERRVFPPLRRVGMAASRGLWLGKADEWGTDSVGDWRTGGAGEWGNGSASEWETDSASEWVTASADMGDGVSEGFRHYNPLKSYDSTIESNYVRWLCTYLRGWTAFCSYNMPESSKINLHQGVFDASIISQQRLKLYVSTYSETAELWTS